MPAIIGEPNALDLVGREMHQIDVHVVPGTPDLNVALRGDAHVQTRPVHGRHVSGLLAQALAAVQVGNDLLALGDLVIVNHPHFHRTLLGWSSRWRGTGIGLPASCSSTRRRMNSTRYLASRRQSRSLGRFSPKSTSNTARLWQSWQKPLNASSSSPLILETFMVLLLGFWVVVAHDHLDDMTSCAPDVVVAPAQLAGARAVACQVALAGDGPVPQVAVEYGPALHLGQSSGGHFSTLQPFSSASFSSAAAIRSKAWAIRFWVASFCISKRVSSITRYLPRPCARPAA